MNIRNRVWVDYLFLFLLLIISMWQLSFLQATMKWDIMDITLPWNYYITECLANGELPFWNPFINGGFAQMGINDTWNPITWLIGWIFGYDPIVIQYQYLGHLFFSGIGFYQLGKYNGWSRTTRLLTASAYMLSGFMIGNAQHLGWTIGASWLPWLFLFFKKWGDDPTFTKGISLAVITALMFLGSYPGIFIGAVYILLFLFVFRVIQLWRNGDFDFFKKITTSAFVSGATFLMLTLVATVGMLRLSQYINRGDSLELKSTLSGSLPWEAILTFLFPYASVSNMVMWENDWTLVNCYFGLIPICFLVFSFFQKLFDKQEESIFKKTKWYLLGGTLFFAIAMGNDLPFRTWMYELIPLMDIFRLPTYFRIFGIFFSLLASGFAIQYFLEKKITTSFYKITLASSIAILAVALWAKNKALIFGQTVIERNGEFELSSDALFYSNMSTQGFLHFMLLVLISIGFVFLKKDIAKKGLLLFVASLDLFFAVQFNMSSTIIAEANPIEVNRAFHQYSPEEYPIPSINEPFIHLHKRPNFDYEHLHINLNHFSKVPSPEGASPAYFKWAAKAIEEGVFQETINHPLIFGAEEINSDGEIDMVTIDTLSFEKIKVLHFSPNQFEFESDFSKPMHLVFLQHFHPDWKVVVDGKEESIIQSNETFMAVKIEEGKRKIKFEFKPKVEKVVFYLSLGSWILVSLFFITMLLRNRIKD